MCDQINIFHKKTPIQIGTYVRDASQTTRTYSFFSTNRLGLISLYVL